ncbi:MAG: signal peptidase II [Candidatus Omnitrophota bacterium]
MPKLRKEDFQKKTHSRSLRQILRGLPIEGRKESQGKTLKFWLIFFALGTFLADQISKLLILKFIPSERAVPVIKNVFYLHVVENKGFAFGLFKNEIAASSLLFAAAAVLFLIGLRIFANVFNGRRWPQAISFGLIIGGAAGNIIDRIRLGYVVDFLDFVVWPVFNIADCAITVAVLILAVHLLKPKTKNTCLPAGRKN